MKCSPLTLCQRLASYARSHCPVCAMKHNFFFFTILFLGIFFNCSLLPAEETEDSFDFKLEEFEKKPLQWGGYIEGKLEHFSLNTESSLYLLTIPEKDRSSLDRATGTLQLKGNYSFAKNSLHWLLMGSANADQEEYDDWADIYETYLRLRPTETFTVEAGKQTYKWGTGYAWNPAAFLNRRKDPNDPGEDLEGFISLESTWVHSFGSTVDSMAASLSILPVWEGVNEDFGRRDNVNLAAKIYLLVKDIDVDLIYFTGNSRSTRYGLDFSSNLTTNFAIHGEFSHIPDSNRIVLTEDGSLSPETRSATSYLLGLRYLSEQNITSIIEYYHNGQGYSEEEMNRYYQLAYDTHGVTEPELAAELLAKAFTVSRSGYGAFQSGKNYGYARVTWKEPFDIVYFTPGITTIVNIDDKSWTITPEFLYTGFTNWELRLRASLLAGGRFSEYGEKSTESKIELRARYFFN